MWGWNDVLPFGSKLGDHNEKQQWVLGVLWVQKDVLPLRTKLDTIITKQTYGTDF
jgi:hypothetical protein